MKTLQQHINETLACSHSEHINEWKASSNTVTSIKKTQYFIYKIDERGYIKIFDRDWPQFNDYKDKVYINEKRIELYDEGRTIKFEPGTYMVEIKDIDDIVNCNYMFWNCTKLIEVPLFDTSKVENMDKMFSYCENLKEVPLFDTSKLENATGMFNKCHKLNNKTKKAWSQIYDFEKNDKKI